MIITCPEHGDYLQSPNDHISGNGCKKCKSSKGEIEVRLFLQKYLINFEEQKRFKGCRNIRPLSFDFFLPNHNLLIEYQGEQHYRETYNGFWGGVEGLKERQKRDQIKRDWCKQNSVRLLEMRYDEDVGEVLSKELEKISISSVS